MPPFRRGACSRSFNLSVSRLGLSSLLHTLTTLQVMNHSQNSRPASQLIAGFATPSTPASARSTLRHSRSAQPSGPPPQPLHGEEIPSVVKRSRRRTNSNPGLQMQRNKNCGYSLVRFGTNWKISNKSEGWRLYDMRRKCEIFS